ncbi:hypothetical protein ABZ038_30365 [Streptomyces sp. NPDC006349]|uniref:hypothetical protein n=1 Tax=Streptomyces sp. NPDC006349 TaxID=3156757 RepID=UPI0033A53D93
MRTYRWCLPAAAVLLLTGCGGGAEGGSAEDRATALTKEQVGEVLPDDEAMAGWKESARPIAVEMDALYRREACPMKGNAGCENSRFFGVSTFHDKDDAVQVNFLIIAYAGEQAAREAYDVLWDGRYAKRAGEKAKPLGLGPVGDERDARLDSFSYKGALGAVTQVRVGTTLLWTEAISAGEGGGVDGDSVRDLAAVLAERSRQAQNGDAPSAVLGG